MLSVGEHIKISRCCFDEKGEYKIYQHHGIYVSLYEVIHFVKAQVPWQGVIGITDLNDFLDGKDRSLLEVVKYSNCFSVNETIRRAKEQLGVGGYHLLDNNCEHFVTWCKTGKAKSEQVPEILRDRERRETILDTVVPGRNIYKNLEDAGGYVLDTLFDWKKK